MKAAKIHGTLAPHEAGNGWMKGWAVLSNTRDSWHLVSVHEKKDAADAEAAELGGSYQAVLGAHRPGTDEFIHDHEADCSAMPLLA
ncbi:hypothetical protein [Pseudomonas sp. GD03746]|uniref:hypothetical protein n=1 Tax=Pseudomonas sp. GD03746 TaxID=2975378 RepID=UPI00244C74A3|nr:hypothetical protein [Pseudomonas sp. GD03746]MDH1575536.1 hypothetical protein [Pseudomonas sp. GD03746]